MEHKIGSLVSTNAVGDSFYADWRKKHFCEEHMPVVELRFQKGRTYGPFYQVTEGEIFHVEPTPFFGKERGHFVGFTKPKSPKEARELYAIPNSNPIACLWEIYLTSEVDDSFGFVGVPRCVENEEIRIGSTLAINFNNPSVVYLSGKRLSFGL